MLRGHPARYVRRDLRSVYRVDPSARPLAATLTSPARRSGRVGASLPRPDPAFKDRDALAASPHGWAFHAPGRYWRAPGLALHPHGLGQHPRQRRERARVRLADGSGDAASRGSGEAPRLATSPRTAWPAGRYGRRVRRRRRPWAPTRRRRGPKLRPGPRGAAVPLWACPSRPVILSLAPRGRLHSPVLEAASLRDLERRSRSRPLVMAELCAAYA